jgi:tetratricopeptide (TPR) repeat protein
MLAIWLAALVSLSTLVRYPLQAGELGQTISVAELRHKPDKKARQAAVEAGKLSRTGDHLGAIDALRRAVQLDPEYVGARGNLGAELMIVGRYEEGIRELREAVNRAPGAAWIQANLAWGLLKTGQNKEALLWSRSAEAIDASNPKVQYVFGCALLRQIGRQAEAIRHLLSAVRGFPTAHRTLAQVYRQEGLNELAREQMQQYAARDPDADQVEARKWIETLH